MTRPIIVLGVDRSGTSMLTDVLSQWGCWAGDPQLLAQPNAFNPQGFWEYRPIQQFLFELFDTVGTGWWNPDFRPALRELGRSPAYRQRAQRLMAEMEVAGTPWVWKEPYFSISLPFWVQVINDPVYVVTLRNPYLSALSYQRFQVPTELQGRFRMIAFFLLRWQFFMRCIVEDTAGHNAMFIAYEDLVSKPFESCARISAHLDREIGVADPDPDKPRRMAQRIDPKLWRNKSELSLDDIGEASPEQRELYACLRRRTQGIVEDIDLARFPMPACFPEYVLNMESLREMLALRGVASNTEPHPAPAPPAAGTAPAGAAAAPPQFPPRSRREPVTRPTR